MKRMSVCACVCNGLLLSKRKISNIPSTMSSEMF